MKKNEAIIIHKLDNMSELFGINKNVFQKIIENMDSPISIKKIDQIDFINKKFYGGRGDKKVIKVNYTFDNKDNEIAFFIKKHCQKNPNEALHYRYLSRFNAPIPKLYAYYSKINHQDIIVTEVVKPFYVNDESKFMLDKEIFKPFIELTAEFNSTQINDKYKKIIINNYDLLDDKLIPFKKKIKNMFKKINEEPIYSNLKNKVNNEMKIKLIETHKNICSKIKEMEKGLYHWDHKPRNMGWSEEKKKYIIFDLEDTLWGPRFYNIGMWLGGSDEIERKYRPREALAKIYLDIYNKRNNSNISVDCLLNESYPLWIAYKIEILLFYFNEAGKNPYRLENDEPYEYKKEMERKFINQINLICNLKIK